MAFDGFLLTKTNDMVVEIAEQDQTAHIFRHILLYSLCKIDAWLQTSGQELM